MVYLLVVLRYLFVVLLYLFLFQVIRAVVRDIRTTAGLTDGTALSLRKEALLKVTSGANQGMVYTLRDCTTIGRDSGNDIILTSPAVSARHAVISRRGAEYWAKDLGSTNGTYLNGERLTASVRLRPQDKITLGETTLQFMG